MRVLIIIPAYNEEKNLKRVIGNLQQVCPQFDYVIVNDGSTDGTERLCRQNQYRHISLPVNLGLSAAVRAGMRYASQKGYDMALQFDADGQHLPESPEVCRKDAPAAILQSNICQAEVFRAFS